MGEGSASFEALYDRQFGPTCRGLALAVGDSQRAEEATQEAFIPPRSSRSGSHCGARRRGAAKSSVDTDELAAGVVQRASVRDAIDQLPERQRLAVVLRYFADRMENPAGWADASYDVELVNPQITQSSARQTSLVVGHFAAGWRVWGFSPRATARVLNPAWRESRRR